MELRLSPQHVRNLTYGAFSGHMRTVIIEFVDDPKDQPKRWRVTNLEDLRNPYQRMDDDNLVTVVLEPHH